MNKAALLAALLCISATASADTEVYDIKINGERKKDPMEIDVVDGHVTFPSAFWRELGLEVAGEEDRSSKDLGVIVTINTQRMTLELTAPAALLKQSSITNAGRFFHKPTHAAPKGVMVDYDVAVSKDDTWRASVAHIGRFGIAGGWVTTTGQINHDQQLSYRRGVSTWNKDLFDHGVSMSAGDVLPPFGSLQSPVNLMGFRIGSDRYLRNAGSSLADLPLINGIADTRSNAQIYVNEISKSQHDVDVGPYVLQGIAAQRGVNDLSVVVRDEFGRESIVSRRFYVSRNLLNAKETDWDLAIGALRQRNDDRYGDLAARVSFGKGLHHAVTLRGSAETTGSNHHATIGTTVALGALGAVDLTGAVSTSVQGTGQAASFAYERVVGTGSITASHEWRSSDHWTLSNYQFANSIKSSTSLSASLRLSPRMHVSGGYTALSFHNDRKDVEQVHGWFNWSPNRQNTIRLGATYDLANKDPSVLASWSYSPRRSTSVTVGALPNKDTYSASLAQRFDRGHARLTYRTDSGNEAYFGSGSYRTDSMQFSGEVRHRNQSTSASTRASGRLWMGEGGVLAAPQSGQEFLLVHIPDHPGSRIKHRRAPATNKRGYTIQGGQPFVETPVRLDVNTTGDTTFKSTTQTVVAPRNGGALVRFEVEAFSVVEFTVRTSDGSFIEQVQVQTVSGDAIVGLEGVMVLNAPEVGDQVVIPSHNCSITLTKEDLETRELICK